MIMTIKELHAALINCISVCERNGINPSSPEAAVWYANDPEAVRLKKLMSVYNNALTYAAASGRVGVDCVAFAQDAMVEAQAQMI
jgi:hypothetical protein